MSHKVTSALTLCFCYMQSTIQKANNVFEISEVTLLFQYSIKLNLKHHCFKCT